jgi:GT2 family glycosyltransferase
MKKCSVIIINFNTKNILRTCLQNLLDLDESLEIIVVDNASSDGSVEMIQKEFSQIKLFPLEKNMGLSFASNVGLSHANGEYLLYLGSDAFPKKGIIVGLQNYFDKELTVGIASAKLILRNGQIDMDAHRGFPTPIVAMMHFLFLDKVFKHSKFFAGYFLGDADLNKPHEIDLCISHFMFGRKKVFEQVGKWDEDYFVFGEDVDMCYRIKNVGWKIMYLPQFEAIHYKGSSIGIRKESGDISTASEETKLNMMRMKAKGMELFYEKHYKNKYPKALNLLVLSAIKGLNFIRMIKLKLKV